MWPHASFITIRTATLIIRVKSTFFMEANILNKWPAEDFHPVKIVLLAAIICIGQACGLHDQSEPMGRMNAQQDYACQSDKGGNGLVSEQIFALVKKIDVLAEAYHKRYQYPSLKEAGILYPYNVNLSPQQPLRITVSLLQKVLDELSNEIETFKDLDLRRWLHNGVAPDFTTGPNLPYDTLYKLRVLVAQLYGLESMALRWENANCHAEELAKNYQKDISFYLILKGYECTPEGRRPPGVPFCLQEVFQGWSRQEYLEMRGRLRPSLISLCSKASGRSVQACEADFAGAVAAKKIMAWYTQYRDQVQAKYYRPLFEMRPGPKNYSCEKASNGKMTIMTIPYVPASDSVDSALLEIGQSYWRQNNQFFIKFVPVNPKEVVPANALKINVQANVLSHVRDDRPNELVISSSVLQNRIILKMTIAHELGHVIGFPDCYIEYLNQAVEEELVYYEVDSSNLMCSMQPGNHIPSQYFDKIIAERCQF